MPDTPGTPAAPGSLPTQPAQDDFAKLTAELEALKSTVGGLSGAELGRQQEGRERDERVDELATELSITQDANKALLLKVEKLQQTNGDMTAKPGIKTSEFMMSVVPAAGGLGIFLVGAALYVWGDDKAVGERFLNEGADLIKVVVSVYTGGRALTKLGEKLGKGVAKDGAD